MTFIAPAHPVAPRGIPSLLGRRADRPRGRLRIADEDGARRALGPDDRLPAGLVSGPSIEHLARIALG